jgi:hypothetical protein
MAATIGNLAASSALSSCLAPGPGSDRGLLALEPFRSLQVRFGMLLGEDDFEILTAYPRGKTWLHNAWLHRQGVVWGFGVGLDIERGEIRVEPGLALDALGRELRLDVPSCVNAGRWLDRQREEDPAFPVEDLGDGRVRLTVHVVARFRPCLDRQVPALAEPCDGAGQTTAYSRVVETVELCLRPGPAPQRSDPPGAEPPSLPYHRLRVLFGLEDAVLPDDQPVLDARDAVLAAAAADRPRALLEAFRDLAALDVIDLGPAAGPDGEGVTLMPGAEPGELVLAEIRDLTLTGDTGAWTLESGEADVTVRFSHVATSTIQELLCGAILAAASGGGGGGGEEGGGEGGGGGGAENSEARWARAGRPGPRIDPASVGLVPRSKRITLRTDVPLAPRSVTPAAFAVTTFDAEEGWEVHELRGAALAADGTTVTLQLKDAPRGALLRVLARGTGSRPLLGADLVPLGAAAGNPHDGHDFAVQIERS